MISVFVVSASSIDSESELDSPSLLDLDLRLVETFATLPRLLLLFSTGLPFTVVLPLVILSKL